MDFWEMSELRNQKNMLNRLDKHDCDCLCQPCDRLENYVGHILLFVMGRAGVEDVKMEGLIYISTLITVVIQSEY